MRISGSRPAYYRYQLLPLGATWRVAPVECGFPGLQLRGRPYFLYRSVYRKQERAEFGAQWVTSARASRVTSTIFMKAKPNSKAKSQVATIYQTIRKPMPPSSRVTKPSARVYVRVKRVDPLFFPHC